MAFKRLQAMRAAAAAAAAQTNQPVPLAGPRIALLPSVYDEPSSASTSPRAGPADQQPLISYDCGDIDMEEADSSPTTHYVSISFTFSQQPQLTFRPRQSHSHTAFSPDAKPFIPPGVNVSARTRAPIATDNMAPPTTAPPKRLPPHLKLQGSALANPVPAASASTISSPAVKIEPPASPSLSVRSHRPAPHTRLGPHAPKASAAPQMQRSAQLAASTPAQNGPPANAQNTLVNLHHTPESDQDTWVKIQEPPEVEASTWVDLRELNVKTGTESTDTDRSSAHVDTKFDSQAPMVVTHGHSPNLKNTASSHNDEILVQATTVTNQDKVCSFQYAVKPTFTDTCPQNNGVHRFGRNEWIPMLLSMKDTDEGRQLVRAFADHIHAGVQHKQTEDSEPNTEKGLFMEFADGQLLPATVPRNTTISEMTKEFAELVQVDESDVSVVLKVHVVEDYID